MRNFWTAAVLAFSSCIVSVPVCGQTALPIPPLLTPTIQNGVKTFSLQMVKGTWQLTPGLTSNTMGFNGPFLGPTIRVSQGDAVHMAVTNHLGEESTVHWHGMHVPAIDDGGIEQIIQPEATWNPEFTIRQPASTNWYHPHIMGSTTKQLTAGLAGMLIVDDTSPASAALPHDYGIDDIPLILQSEITAADGGIKYDENTFGTATDLYPILANGVNVSTLPVFNASRNRVRLRLLNASMGDILNLSFTDGSAFTEVATDGGYLPTPVTVNHIRLGPAERIEIIVDLAGNSRTLQATPEVTLVRGASGTRPVLQINPASPAAPLPALPSTLNTITPLNISGSPQRTFQFTQDGAHFGINGVDGLSMETMMMNAIHVHAGATEVWDIVNTTGGNHYFHMHDVSFQILSINGVPPTGDLVGWKDTVEVPVGATVQIAMRFSDFSDSQNAYMLHCHLTPHEDLGMMALFYVDPVESATANSRMADFDNDGRPDYVVHRPGNGTWYVTPSSTGIPFTTQWGLPNDVPVTGDFDGDGRNDYAVWRPAEGMWYIIPSTTGLFFTKQWGLPGDVPVPGDFDGDGKTDYAVWRPAEGMWYITPSTTGVPYVKQWGLPGDIPLVADFDADGISDFVVWRPAEGMWYITPSSNPDDSYMRQWGLNGDVPVVGDFDGDHKIDYAVWRPAEGMWYITPSTTGVPYVKQWGLPGDVPLPSDFDHDGKADFVVWRPANGTWYVTPSSNPSAPYTAQWGLPGDIPIAH